MNTNHTREWKVLCWNVRGLNSDKKWDSIRNKIVESQCDVICLQETKRTSFDIAFVKFFCPTSFDAFEFLPLVGASGGIIVAWKSALFEGHLSFQNSFVILVDFRAKHSDLEWVLTNVYGPCMSEGKLEFTSWLKNIQMPDDTDWLGGNVAEVPVQRGF